MLNRITIHLGRIDKFAAACYGRGKSAISLGAWFTLDGVVGGGIKSLLKARKLGWVPAAANFIVFLAYFIYQAKVTHDLHPDSCDLLKEGKKFKATTEMILGQFKKYPKEAGLYLEGFKSEHSLIQQSLSSKDIQGSMKLYDQLHNLYNELKPHQVEMRHQLADGLVHGLSYFYEYTLLVYFEELNILNTLFSSESLTTTNALGVLVLIFSLASAFQAYSFAAVPKVALEGELLKEISDDFLSFREASLRGYGAMYVRDSKPPVQYELKIDLPSTDEQEQELELIRHYATASSARRCYLHS